MTTDTDVPSRIATDPGMTPAQPPAVSLPLPRSGDLPQARRPAPEHGEVEAPRHALGLAVLHSRGNHRRALVGSGGPSWRN